MSQISNNIIPAGTLANGNIYSIRFTFNPPNDIQDVQQIQVSLLAMSDTTNLFQSHEGDLNFAGDSSEGLSAEADSSKTYIIIIAVAGALIVAVATILLVYFCRYSQKSDDNGMATSES